MTNGDALVVGATGGKSVTILINDYSNGNDMIVAKPGIKSLKDLKGKKIGVEMGFVDHLLLLNGLEKAGMKESDVTLVNTKTNETPQVLASGDVDAIGAWQPSSGQAMKLVAGSTAIYTSAEEPGLIYDVLAVNPASLSSRRAEWLKVVKVWDRVVAYINDPKTSEDAVKILAGRVGLKPEEYKPFLGGTKLQTLAEGKKIFEKGDGFKSIYGSSKIVDDFNIKYEVYKEKQDVGSYLDPSLTNEVAK
jgi:NitT/TauT family transport system substrate-binding protein